MRRRFRRSTRADQPTASKIDGSGFGPEPGLEPDKAPGEDEGIRARLASTAEALGLHGSMTEDEVAASDETFGPFISVVLPVHDDEMFVAEALRSVKGQAYAGWECIVVDDASSDASWRVIQSEVGEDDRFRTIRNDLNLGPGGARNVGIAQARGEYLAFLDGDDLLMSASLQDRVDALASHIGDPYVVGSFCGVRFSHEGVKLDELADHYRSTQPAFVDFVIADGEVPFPMTAPLVEIDRVRSIGGFDESMVSGGVDWDLWYRILRNGHVFVSSPYQSVVYRQRAGGITRGNPAAHVRAAARLIRAAHDPADPAILVDRSPFPMPGPLGAYRSTLEVASRAVRFGSMALVDGDRAAMVDALAVLEHGTLPLLERHLDIPSLVLRGAARALGRRPDDLHALSSDLDPFVAAVADQIVRAAR